jgi:fatty acid desaturase
MNQRPPRPSRPDPGTGIRAGGQAPDGAEPTRWRWWAVLALELLALALLVAGAFMLAAWLGAIVAGVLVFAVALALEEGGHSGADSEQPRAPGP